jgi:DNA primase large subunit
LNSSGGDDPIGHPMDSLNNFVALILEKIVNSIHRVVELPASADDYGRLASSVANGIMYPSHLPIAFKELHENFISDLRGYEYLQKFKTTVSLEKFPELTPLVNEFHRNLMQKKPTMYRNLNIPAVMKLLDEEDKAIIEKYHLNVEKIWNDYVKTLSE